jgi:hypothetical protein
LLVHTNHPSAVQVKFLNYNDSVTRVAGRLQIPTCAQGTFCFRPRVIILSESTQIRWFLRWSGWEGWSGRAVAQRRPRVSKLGLKGLSNYYSYEITVKAARRGDSGLDKRSTLTKYLLKKRELHNSSKPNLIRAKGSSPQRKTPLLKKSYSLYLWVTLQSWWCRWRWWWVSHSQVFQGTED